MNKLILKICFLFLFSCNSFDTTVKKSNQATAQTMNGMAIFIKSKPLNEYEFLGSLELKIYDKLLNIDQQNFQSAIKNITGLISFSDNLESILLEVKQKYPIADGVIFDDELSRCEAIKFK